MTHDRHLVQRRLTIEQDDVSVHHVTFDFVTVLETLFTRLLQEAKIESLTIFTNDVTRTGLTRRRMRAVLNQALKAIDVVRRHGFRIRHVQRDGPRNSELVEHQVWIGRNDGTRREIHALTHQVASNSTRLALQTL